MEYSDSEKKDIRDYWNNYYVTNCNKCNGLGFINDRTCTCIKNANASYYCEINGFGRDYLKRKINDSELKNNIYNYYITENNKSIYLCGPYNVGKTIAITSLAKRIVIQNNPLLLNNFSVKFFLYDDLTRISLENNAFSYVLEPIIKKTDILILDNIGSEKGLNTAVRSSVSLLENILRNREIRGKRTWITSNILPKDIIKIYSEQIFNIIKRTSEIWTAF